MDRKEAIEIPFGAFGSELKGWEYTIPEGMKAVIKDGKIIVREKESEDERIKRAIIATIHLYYGEPLEDEAKEMVAWLKKQGEQKCNEVKPIEGEFPYVNPSDNLDDEIDNIWNRLKCNGVFTATKEGFKEVICHFVNFVRKNHTWSEEDEKMLASFLHELEACALLTNKEYQWADKKLKAIKERVQLQTSVWSKEDEEHVNSLLKRLDGLCRKEFTPTRFAVNEDEDWLKSLKNRYTWKPSDEQMNALNYVVNLMASSERPTENDLYYNILKSLRQQLKKLKG